LDEVGIDQSHNLSAQRLILFNVVPVDDLEPDFEIRVTNENDRILLVTVPGLSKNQPSSGLESSTSRPALRLSTIYLARRSLILVPSSWPKMIRGSPL